MIAKPNIILIVLDAVRADHMSCYGYGRSTTPNIDLLAEQRGIVFESAFSAAPWTTPSHASLFTGKYPSQCGIVGTHLELSKDNLTMAEFLRRYGYRTAATGNAFVTSSLGFDYGFEEFVESWRRPSTNQIPLLGYKLINKMRARIGHSNDKGDYLTWHWFRRWLRNTHEQGPFFAFLRFVHAHAPYSPGPTFRKRFAPPLEPGDDLRRLRHLADLGRYSFMAGKLTISDREWEILKAWYDACILQMDKLIGQIIDLLSDQGLLETTLLIITADHGENFGEHGLADHVYCVYDTLLHVPLIVAGPRDLVPQRKRIKHLVSLVDIFPSVIHLIDSGNPLARDLCGKSIWPLDGFPMRDRVFAEYGPPFSFKIFQRLHPDFSPKQFDRAFKTVRTTSHKYILASDGNRELYDLATDPSELENKVTQFPQLATWLHQQLTDTLGTFDELPCSEPNKGLSIEEDKELAEHLRMLGYL